MPRKDFTDERVSKKQRQLDKDRRSAEKAKERLQADKKALKQSKRETKTALENHRLGWTTRDGKEL